MQEDTRPAAFATWVAAAERTAATCTFEDLQRRLDCLERIESWLLVEAEALAVTRADEFGPLRERARTLAARIEADNFEQYDAIRQQVRHGHRPRIVLDCVGEATYSPVHPADDDFYDHLDSLVAGVLRFDDPAGTIAELEPEMVFYQPTPARHIFELIARAAPSESDVLVDLGSGLGHVPLLTAICTPAHCIGIEREAAYVDCARRCASALELARVEFLQQDVRSVDFSRGTLFYLYTPFTGAIMREVLDALRREADQRVIRVASFGPCTDVVGAEPWLKSAQQLAPDRVVVFGARS